MQLKVIQCLAILFVVLLFLVCRKKGFRSLISLGLTVVIILKVFIPLLLKGYDPTIMTIILALPILLLVIYCTEGFNNFSHVAIAATIISFVLTSFLTWISIVVAGLSGLTSEEAAYAGGSVVNLQGLLIAGIIIGTLGALIEMVITQVATVTELINTEVNLSKKQIFKQAYAIGVAHLNSMINTLFLIYAGVSLPILIILFGNNYTWNKVLNFEIVTSEIIRILTSTIGLIISMPIATALAVWWLGKSGTGKKNQL